jgi:hypothetical protein
MDEKNRALMEAHQIAAEDEYFAARPQIDSNDRRKVFEAGFQRAWEKVNSEHCPSTCLLPDGSVDMRGRT